MKRYTYLHAPVYSFFSKSLYQSAGLRWNGTGFLYLIVLLATLWIPLISNLNIPFDQIFQEFGKDVARQLPVITIENGEVSIEEEEPYFVMDRDYDYPVLVIDTTGQITDPRDVDAVALLTKRQLIQNHDNQGIQVHELENIQDMEITPEMVEGWLDLANRLATPVLYCIMVLAEFVFRIVQALIYGALGLLMAHLLRANLPYLNLIRLAVIAITPVLLIKTLFSLADVDIPYGHILNFLIAMWYLFFGVRAVAQEQHTPPPIPPLGVPDLPEEM